MDFERNEGLLNILSDAISEGLVVVNERQTIVSANKSTHELFGYEKDSLIGKPLNTLIPRNYHSIHSVHFKKFMDQREKRCMGVGGDLFGIRKDGSQFPVEVGLNPFEVSGKAYIMALVIDITERKNYTKKLERTIANRTSELKKALEKEHELGELKSRFVSMASHEFRTPLTAIVSSTDLIKKYNDLGVLDKQEKHFDRIKGSVSNLITILDDFLSLEKIESDNVLINSMEINFREYIQDILLEVKPWSKDKQQVVHEHNGASEICIDPNLTRNILLNLLSNALKYSPDESTVELISQNQGGKLVLKVKDKGMGIPKEDQKNMFTRFYRASNANEISGTGLGLTIVKRYLELMGGDISFISEVGKGTTFKITIPLA
jgi:PAS domain S-box-containing protein